MRRKITREYELTDTNVRSAIWAWLKGGDVPVPNHALDFLVEMDGESYRTLDCKVSFTVEEDDELNG